MLTAETCVSSPGTAANKNCPSDYTTWSRPFFAGALMFFGMTFTLIPFFFMRYGKPGVTKIDRWVVVNMIIPTILEYIGQILFMYGLKNIPMALSMTLKGSRVVFSAILVVIFLKRQLFKFHWTGVALTVLGLVIASLPTFMEPKDKSKSAGESALGIALVLSGEFARSFKGVFEERLMKRLHYDALMVVGLQGLFAFLFSIPVLAVVHAIQLDGKPLEDFSVSWKQFSTSPIIWGLSMTFPITVSGLFLSGAYVVKLMSTVHNALTGIITTSIVWVVTIIIHKIDSQRGVQVAVIDLLQLTGFAIVVLASLLYDSIIRLPWFYYPADRAAASGAGSSVPTVSKAEADVVIDEDIAETAKQLGYEDKDLMDSDEEQVTILPDDDSQDSPIRRRT